MRKTLHVSGFPKLIAAEEVRKFLEGHTCEGAIEALEVKPGKRGSRAYAKVQFTSKEDADKIIHLANIGLYYYLGNSRSYLKAFEQDTNFVNHRSFMHELDGLTLNFGCQVSKDRFSVLWRAANVSVKFGSSLNKMHLFVCDDLVEYRLQLSYENIWQIVLYNSSVQTERLLLIQLFGAPRIYKKLEYSVYSFYRETPDDQWVRTTDFTPSCIGQSSGLCLQLPRHVKLPDFKNNFMHYTVSEEPFQLVNGAPFCGNLPLVPIVQPPRGLELPYKLLFKVCSLVQTGCLPGMKLDTEFFQCLNPRRYAIRYIEHALDKLYYIKECCYDPVAWLREQYRKYQTFEELPKPPTISLDDGLVYVHRVQVTPTRVYFAGPEVNMSNRVLRQFSAHIDNFLRVSFIDEEWDKMYSTDLSPKVATGVGNGRTKLYERVLSTLRNGITIGEKRFQFLAFSSSQLRENSLWMFAPVDGLTADDIRRWMGDFSSIRNVAKYAARLGQSFSSSTETLKVAQYEVERIPDVEVVRDGTTYIFSDGIGKISSDFARRVATKCGIRDGVPSAFQIRYGGYKGVVAVDPTSSMKLSLRKSMLKYQSDNTKLDVLSWSKYQPCFMNRQIITLLSTLGVRDHVFEKKQREAVTQLDDILVDPLKAQDALDLMSPGENTNILKEMLKCGYKPDEEPFLSMMLQTFRLAKLLDLRVKARIFVPQARQMMGCMDETGTLEYGEVFVQFSGTGSSGLYEGTKYTVTGKVAVAKNPCLHPGDVRVLRAVDVQELQHMVDCVVFPRKGKRPHPNECSGSDLDGDIYFVCWDPELIPPNQEPPMTYNPAPNTLLDHNVTIEEVEEYFTNYIVNDSLGIIANAHTAFADKERDGALSSPCLELAQLFSVAVDFPKTGIPAEIPPHLRVKEYPDFMDKPDKTTYTSERIIGKLYRQVKDIAPHAASLGSFTMEVAMRSYDTDMEVEGFREYIDEAFEFKTEYDYKLGNMMDYYGIKTEAEILSGAIMKTSKTFDRRKDADAIGASVRALRNEARSWFKKGSESGDAYAMASAWYHVTYDSSFWGCYNVGMKRRGHYISFPWCVYDKLVQIKRAKSARISSLNRHFRNMKLVQIKRAKSARISSLNRHFRNMNV
ncbi:probable RNA-dependent RNA polymerase 1 [Salvia miltiorrhiza]|uniref:probable RNA-dependent RNA polymerase 1 n=1 Tax=Salvia miltiorrhiza TaxID=226208 RepID=UPI0025AC701E|nr:probable RNA-dependent RNA polymerase 1 [Salvia miltiorrhiza]